MGVPKRQEQPCALPGLSNSFSLAQSTRHMGVYIANLPGSNQARRGDEPPSPSPGPSHMGSSTGFSTATKPHSLGGSYRRTGGGAHRSRRLLSNSF